MAACHTIKGLSASDCPVCFEELGDEKVPFSLTCGHTLCLVCVKRLSQGKQCFLCPLCREEVPVSSVKRNVTLFQLISQLRTGLVTSLSQTLTIPFESIQLGPLLDRGASGEVYRGTWQENDVAIKVFSSGQLSEDAHVSFRREVCVMNTLRHPNVVLLLAASPIPPRLAIVMEYVGGGSLYSHLYIDKTPISVEFTAQLIADISRGLQYLHSINILHRDLKSKNVLLTGPPPVGQAKLCDFGLARMRLESATMTGNIGTVHWTAPEILNCGHYNFSADIYSLGMVIYEMISRSIPFSNLPPPAVIVAVLIRREKPKPPVDTNCIFASLMDRCTSWEPIYRPSISSILRDLAPLLSSSSSLQDIIGSCFDHTDSLGHVMIEFELDDDEDVDLMRFLQDQSNDEETKEERDIDLQQDNILPETALYEDVRGVLSQQELDKYHNMTELDDDEISYSSQYLPSWGRSYQVPSLPVVPANRLLSIDPMYNDSPPVKTTPNVHSDSQKTLYLQQLHRNSAPILPPVTETTPTTPPPRPNSEVMSYDGFKTDEDILLGPYYDRDRELALKLQQEEQKQQLIHDYRLASQLQRKEHTASPPLFRPTTYSSTLAPPPPPPLPPPPPPTNPILKIPTKVNHLLVVRQVKTTDKRRKLKHVETVEKKAFNVGRVVDGTNSELTNFTLQKEIAAFNHSYLYKVDFHEPPPAFPVGRVVEMREGQYVKPIINRLNSVTQSEILTYKKSKMKHVRTEEKTTLPTHQDIETEKNPPSSQSSSPPPPPPPPPPSQTPSSPSSVIVKSRVLSPFSKKGVPPKETKKVSAPYERQLSKRTYLDEDQRLKSAKKSQAISSDVSKEVPFKKAVPSKQSVWLPGKVSIDEKSAPRLSSAKKHLISKERPPKNTVTSEQSVSQSPVKVSSDESFVIVERKPKSPVKKSEYVMKKKGKK